MGGINGVVKGPGTRIVLPTTKQRSKRHSSSGGGIQRQKPTMLIRHESFLARHSDSAAKVSYACRSGNSALGAKGPGGNQML